MSGTLGISPNMNSGTLDKWPIGHVVQAITVYPESGAKTLTNGTGATSGGGDTWAEWDSAFRITMTPRSATNLITLTATFLHGGNASGILHHFRFANAANGNNDSIVGSTFTGSSDRTPAHGSSRMEDQDLNDVHSITITAQETAGAGARTYYCQGGNEGTNSTTRYYNATGSTSYQLAYVRPFMMVQEIQQ